MKIKKLVFILIGIGVGISLVFAYVVLKEGKTTVSLKVLNSDFEMGLDKPDSWREDPRGGWSIDTEEPYIGKRYMQATESWSYLWQEVAAEPERFDESSFCQLEVYVKSDIEAKENALLTLECLDKNSEVIEREYGVISATSSWQSKKSLILTPKDTRKIRIKIAKRQGEGSVWFDGVELIQTDSVPLTVGSELLNPSFEMGLDKPDYWREDPKGGWSIETEDPYIGKRCMQATESWSYIWQEVAAEPERFDESRFCQLEVYVKSDIEAGENALLTLESLNGKGGVVKREYGVISATSSWQSKKSLIFLPKDKDIRRIRIGLAKRQGEGSVWFDGVKLIRTSSFPILNPSFEMGLDKPDSWREDTKGGWSIETEDPYIGKRYMQATESWSYLWQEVPAEPEKFYKLRVSVKSDIVAGENALLTLECRKEDGTVVGTEYGVINATSSWQLQENSILAPKDTRKIRIKLAKRQGGGSVWFDGVELKKLSSYMRMKFLRAVAEDKPFFIFYFLIYALLFFSLLKIVLKK